MKLILKSQLERLIKNGQSTGDHAPVVKLFTPFGAATWLLSEIVPDTNERLAFGLADLGMGSPELGYIDLDELARVRGPGPFRNLGVERDMHWSAKGKPLSQFADEARAKGRIVA
jgi:hypothetical protein